MKGHITFAGLLYVVYVNDLKIMILAVRITRNSEDSSDHGKLTGNKSDHRPKNLLSASGRRLLAKVNILAIVMWDVFM